VIDRALVENLGASRQKLSDALRRQASNDATGTHVGAWSVRDVAAHLAACEVECIEPRVQSIVAGYRPRFAFYSNDTRDFSAVRTEDALAEWAVTRARLLEFALSLTQDELARVGVHSKFGEVTVARYLGIALEHDREHLRDLQQAMSAPAR
jgi:hypothetical protein